MSLKDNNPAAWEGKEAYREGKDYHTDNPYPVESSNWHHWRWGWRTEKERVMPQAHRPVT